MAKLEQLQTQLQQYIEGENELIIKQIVNSDDAQAGHRLAAYYNAYRVRLIDAIAVDFPALQHFLGEEDFAWLILDYLKAYPSHYSSVSLVAQDLPQFIASQSHQHKDFLVELAQFEWAQRWVFDQREPPVLFNLEKMAHIAPEHWPNIRIDFVDAMKVLHLHYNVVEYWQAVENQQSPPKPSKSEYPVTWLVWRKDYNPHWRSLDVHEAWALQQAQQGASFQALCEGLCEWIDAEHIALTAAGFLKQWISDDVTLNIIT